MYPDHKAQKEKFVSPYIYYVLRPISITPSKFLHKVGITANTCTTFSVLVLVIGLFFLTIPGFLGSWIELIAGSLLVNFYLYLDVVDGNLARLSKSSSNFGEFYDSTLNIFAGFSVPVFVSVGLYKTPGIDIIFKTFNFSSWLFLLCGVAIGLLRLFRRTVMDNIDRLNDGERFSMLDNNIGKIDYFAAVINSAVFPLLLISILLNIISLWFLLYLGLNFVGTVLVLRSGYKTLTNN